MYVDSLCVFLSVIVGNAILNASTPVMDELSSSEEGFITLDASGMCVHVEPKYIVHLTVCFNPSDVQ